MKKIYIYGAEEKFENYKNAIAGCGGEPFFSTDPADAGGCDGLLLPGGGDVAPHFYGQENRGSFMIDEELDKGQMEIIRVFAELNKPILGICRGMQILNVAFGGDLIQDIETASSHKYEESTGDKVHMVNVDPESFLFPLYGDDFSINSAHHQAIDRPAEGFTVTARAEDGVPEAMENRARKIYAVQFHPERMSFQKRREDTVDGRYIFDFFLSIC